MPDDSLDIPAWAELLDQMMVGAEGEQAAILLKQAALTAIYRRAGKITPVAKNPPELHPAPPEILPPCKEREVSWALNLDRQMPQKLLIPSWFIVLHQNGKRVPHSFLPALLNLGKRAPDLCPLIMRVMGERGRWLVERDEDYALFKQAGLWTDAAAQITLKTLEEWQQDPRYLDWYNNVPEVSVSFRDSAVKAFEYAHTQIMEGLAR